MSDDLVKDYRDRFWSKVDRRSDDECWPWLAAKGDTKNQSRAYGQFWVDGKTRKASQISWEIFHGEKFPEGKMACHTCDNPPCVNPRHIWPGTMSENIRDCVAKGRHPKPAGGKPQNKTVCVNGHEYTAENTRFNNSGRKFCVICNKAAKRKWQKEKQSAHRAKARQAMKGQSDD